MPLNKLVYKKNGLGNILRNLTRTHEYDDNIVTSQLDASTQVRQFYRSFRNVYNSWFGGTGKRDNGNFLQKRVPDTVAFPCNTNGYRSEIIPKNVNRLRPGSDIDVVVAIEDSLTSATSANSAALWEVLVENRGVACCIGGQGSWRSHLTLPNILKEFNPKIFGYSLQDAFNVHQSAQFNVAENIATVTDMPYMAKKLVDLMILDPRSNADQKTGDSYDVLIDRDISKLFLPFHIKKYYGNMKKILRDVDSKMDKELKYIQLDFGEYS